MKLSDIKLNPNNPRHIKDEKFKKLVKSIKDFPKMMELRPIIINDENIIIGGNMRYRALKELGHKDIPETWVKQAKDYTKEELDQFLIKDNMSFGENDYEMLANQYEMDELIEWGFDDWELKGISENVDYSILDNENLDNDIESLRNGVMRGIQIEFETQHHQEAQELLKFLREKKVNLGLIILERLRHEKNKFN